jgi:hypothetical protein
LSEEQKYKLIQKLVNSVYHSYGEVSEIDTILLSLLEGTDEPEQRKHLEFLYFLMKSYKGAEVDEKGWNDATAWLHKFLDIESIYKENTD